MAVSLKALPTALTVARLVAAPCIAGLILWADSVTFTLGAPVASLIFAIALGLFALAAITDAADGVLARRLDAISPLGAALDHAADKALTSCTLIALAATVLSRDLIIVAILLIARDLVIGGLREGLALAGKALPVSGLGKAKTAIVLTGIGAAMLLQTLTLGGGAQQGVLTALTWLARGALWIGLILALWSAVSYVRAAIKPIAAG